jgi:predicted transcriptional regulator
MKEMPNLAPRGRRRYIYAEATPETEAQLHVDVEHWVACDLRSCFNCITLGTRMTQHAVMVRHSHY